MNGQKEWLYRSGSTRMRLSELHTNEIHLCSGVKLSKKLNNNTRVEKKHSQDLGSPREQKHAEILMYFEGTTVVNPQTFFFCVAQHFIFISAKSWVQVLSLYAADPDNQDWPVHMGEQKHLGGVLCPLGPAEQSWWREAWHCAAAWVFQPPSSTEELCYGLLRQQGCEYRAGSM